MPTKKLRHAIALKFNLNCMPKDSIANGIIRLPIFFNTTSSMFGIKYFGINKAIKKHINGGNENSFLRMLLKLTFPVLAKCAIKTPNDDIIKKLPGWSTKIAYCIALASYNCVNIGNPTNEVLPKPQLKIKHATVSFDNFNFFDINIKKSIAPKNIIQADSIGSTTLLLISNLGILYNVIAGSGIKMMNLLIFLYKSLGMYWIYLEEIPNINNAMSK